MWSSKRLRSIPAQGLARRRTRPGCEVLEGRALLAAFHVSDVAGLQAAVAAVNATPSDRNVIVLAAGTYDLTGEIVFSTQLVTIQGDSSGKVVLDNPTHSAPIFNFAESGSAVIRNLIISGGSALNPQDNGGSEQGGGVSTQGNLTVENCTISNNTAYEGGGIYCDGVLSVKDSTISNNTATYIGGGISCTFRMTLKDSAITGNSAARAGGGVFFGGGLLTISGGSVTGNSAGGEGGGLFAEPSDLIVRDCSISGNTAAVGGGLYAVNSTAEIDDSTLNDPVGGGIVNVGSTIHLKNTVVDGVLYKDQHVQ